MRLITTDSLTNQNIATALLLATYTADADRMLYINVRADQVAGAGDYVVYLTRQHLGTGSHFRQMPQTTATVPSGVTAIAFPSIGLPVKSTDVIKVYLTGLAGDTTTPDTVVEWWEDELFITVGAAGAGLTAIPWNAAWDAEVQSEVDDALVAHNLDHIAGTATGIPSIPAGTYLDQMMDDGSATFDRTTDSLQAIRDNMSAGSTGALASGTAQTGSTSTTIKLASGASTTDDLYRYLIVLIDGGTGAGQARMVTDYVGSTRVATVDRAWITAPDATSTYRIHHWSDNWAATERTLTTPGSTSADTTTVSAISRRRGDRWTINLTGLGDISTRTKLWFTIKNSANDADSAAWIQITEAAGLIVVYGGGSITAGNASITVTDAATGAITITVRGVETAKLPARTVYHDVQVLRVGAGDPDTIAEGSFTVRSDITRSTS